MILIEVIDLFYILERSSIRPSYIPFTRTLSASFLAVFHRFAGGFPAAFLDVVLFLTILYSQARLLLVERAGATYNRKFGGCAKAGYRTCIGLYHSFSFHR